MLLLKAENILTSFCERFTYNVHYLDFSETENLGMFTSFYVLTLQNVQADSTENIFWMTNHPPK